ncbi:hypothetical protein RHMOL_Rhmol12G0143800 [Rhododendron molle]|uniref:Uncharacterized protein n=8 Tax=Rhododendron molle TaxID=49168 RepID=A0ACC0LJ22_RHOML|nr:hypothetical protein RHMOL_Rhmol12G0143800 [Rhododendron molle]KAI8528362.1 hypothetical protein RHMOL_Rhmol12G0143800 [Rhododendron molle]KAI8528363.1 hypothetical protein RHMOL_Rhmol12G0143800 [Rhododendron molle]KAI8528364.1 hypothetical protein RHMOL_Rhmol12G0143800 [Rhododendron molle]KAI8528366.1 hypothetical protein RHMOL_Rhmol12G0143800 [Rhododendron molle]
MTLSWGQRLRIALGVARALETYARLSDCGLAVLRPLTSNNVKLKASEMAISNTGYVAPEHIQNGFDSVKGGISAFGVLLLELLTGTRPFDGYDAFCSTKGRAIPGKMKKWASSRLHDNESLENMVDPNISKLLSSRAVSRFPDIVSLCVQILKLYYWVEEDGLGTILGQKPGVLAEEASKIASMCSNVLSATILDADQCKELKIGSYLGVAGASANPPHFIHLCYKPPSGPAKTKLALVGRGLTFDSSLLTSAGAEVHFIVAACENMISGTGMRPGDIVTASNGKTIDVCFCIFRKIVLFSLRED